MIMADSKQRMAEKCQTSPSFGFSDAEMHAIEEAE